MRTCRKIICGSFGIAALLLLFGSYPIALLPPGLSGDSYYVHVPAAFILTLLSLPVIAASRFRGRPAVRICIGVFSAAVVYRLARDPSSATAILAFLGCCVVPLAVTHLYGQWQHQTVRAVMVAAFVMWLLLTIYGALNLRVGLEVIGITGNRNWMAICLLAVLPWGAYGLWHRLRPSLGRGGAVCMTVLIAGLPTFFLVYKCASRSAWLALGVFSVLWVFRALGRRSLRILLGFATVTALACVPLLFGAQLLDAFMADIRLPIWFGTARMIADNPLTGVGPAEFLRQFPEYLASTAYHRRLVASETIIHPHNEFLNLAANIGIPAAVSWLLLLVPLIQDFRRRSGFERMAQFSAFVICFQGLLDKSLVQAPASIFAMCCLGLCWRRFIIPIEAQTTASPAGKGRVPILSAALGICAVAALAASWKNCRRDWHLRRAAQYERSRLLDRELAHFRRALAADPKSPEALYGAGALAIEGLADPELALEYLHRGYALNPNYGHINRLLGLAYGRMNSHERALEFFARDCHLFPRDTGTFHYYFTALALAGRLDKLAEIDAHLSRLYREKSALTYRPEIGRKLADDWRTAVQIGDVERALEMARHLCIHPISIGFVDPLFARVATPEEWPLDIQYGGFTMVDFSYWEAIIERRKIVDEITSETEGEGHRGTQVQHMFKGLQRRLVIDAARPGYLLPHKVWQEKRGNPTSVLTLLAWIYDGDGVPTLLPGSHRARRLLIQDGGQLREIRVGDTAMTLAIAMKPATGDGATDMAPGMSAQPPPRAPPRLFFYPQAFFLRNQVLGILIQHYLPTEYPGFANIPIIAMIERTEQFHSTGMRINLDDCCAPEPLRRPRGQVENQ